MSKNLDYIVDEFYNLNDNEIKKRFEGDSAKTEYVLDLSKCKLKEKIYSEIKEEVKAEAIKEARADIQKEKNNLQSLMDIKLTDITRQAVQQAINHDAVCLSPKSISNAYGLLSAALGVYAPDFNCKVTLPKKQKKIKELPKPEEVFNTIKGTEIELPCLLAMWLSLRMSEVRGLRKSDIQNGKIIIQNSVVTADGKRVEKSATKTYDSTRIEDLPQYISDLINKVETEYITELSGQAIYKRFVRLLDKNGLPHMTFHDLRHLNASVMLQLGVPDKYAMERGGWSTTSTLKSVYQHTFSEEREAVNRKINEYFENIVNDNDD